LGGRRTAPHVTPNSNTSAPRRKPRGSSPSGNNRNSSKS
jgi:hypothetical protein